MTVSSTTNRVSFTGNGVTTAFSFPYYIQAQADLKVLLVLIADGTETLQTITTHYTISGTLVNGVYPSGVTVTMLSAPSSSHKLVIYRDPALTQAMDLVENDPLPAETLEQAVDRAILISQRLDERMDRSINLPDGFTATFDPSLPSDINTANAVLVVNAAGTGWDVGPTTTEIEDAEAEATAAAASALLASQWATLTSGQVASTDYSAKAWAIGGTGVTDTASRGAAKEWAIETASTVDGTDYSAKEWAKGTQVRGIASGGSAKDWANYTSGTVDNAEYSAKYYANAAAVSAAAAATYAAASQWDDVSYKVFGDSPITLVDADSGTLYEIDCTGGNVVVNLPSIAALSLTGPWSVGFKKTDSSSNTITLTRNGTDTIDGSTTKVISRQYAGCNLIPDTDASPDKWTSLSFGEVPISGAVVGTTDTQTLTNKTFDDALTIKEIATPSTPASGYGKAYFKSDGKLYVLNDDGTETQVGSGSGGINYLSANPDAESGVTGYSMYLDASAVSPVDMDGGSPASTFTRNTSTPLRGTGQFRLSKSAANRQGEGVAFQITIANADVYKSLCFSGEYRTSASYADNDIRMYVYDVSNGAVIEPVGTELKATGNTGKFYCYFQATSSTSYRIGFHIASTNASAWDVDFDTLVVGPVSLQNGSFTSDWVSFTPTGSWSTNTTYAGRWRRVGDSMDLDIYLTTSGAPTSASLTVNLPSGFTIDQNKLSQTSSNYFQPFGVVGMRDSGVDSYEGIAQWSSTTAIAILKDDGDGTISAVTQTAPFTWGSGDYLDIRLTGIPITGWSSGVQMTSSATNAVIAFKASLTGNQAIGSSSATLVTFNTVSNSINGSYDTSGSFDTTNSRFIAPESGRYFFCAHMVANSDVTASAYYSISFRLNGVSKRAFRWYFNDTVGQWTGFESFNLVKGDYVDIATIGDASYTIIGGDGSSSAVFEGFKIQGNQTIGMDEVVAASYTTDAGLSIADNTDTTVVFEDKIFDTHNAMNTSTGIYTIPVAGKYLVNTNVGYATTTSWTIAEQEQLYIQKNSTSFAEIRFYYPATSASAIQEGQTLSALLDCVAGDAIRVRVNQNSGGALGLSASANRNNFNICRIK